MKALRLTDEVPELYIIIYSNVLTTISAAVIMTISSPDITRGDTSK